LITIIDYKVGNLGSIKNMLKKIGQTSVISSEAEAIKNADKLILPGVGAFDNGIKNIKELGLWDAINDKVKSGTPILGICLGAQLMTTGSEEGIEKGFGWVDAETVRFQLDPVSKLKIPNMGWMDISIKKKNSLIDDAPTMEHRFYFVHAYHFKFHNDSQVLATAVYDYEFPAAFEKDNILGVQFHPEKSHRHGMELFEKFIKV